MEIIETQFKILKNSLTLLGSSYQVQRDLIEKFAIVQDEVIDSFYNAFLLLPQLIENDLLSKKAISAIIRCYVKLELLLQNPNIDSSNEEVFKAHEEWEKVRELAKLALINLENTND